MSISLTIYVPAIYKMLDPRTVINLQTIILHLDYHRCDHTLSLQRGYSTDIGWPQFGHPMKVYNVKLIDESCPTMETRPIYVSGIHA